ncbi:hypothetical protein, partial [Brevibacillus agri]|uniref:hypothetical protein n=1 Tax=Brevibacillus agri TaxID=51101 RepID=UPI003D1915E1
ANAWAFFSLRLKLWPLFVRPSHEQPLLCAKLAYPPAAVLVPTDSDRMTKFGCAKPLAPS